MICQFYLFFKKKKKGSLEDGREVRRRYHFLPHKYIKNTSACGTERTTGRKARGPQAAEGNKLQVADFFFFSLIYTELKEASYNSMLMTPGSVLR